jgi:hypothetical protein
MIWRERRVLLLILAVLLLGNIVFFLTYRVQYQSRLDDMNERLAQAEGQLAKSRQARTHADAQLQAYKKVERDVTEVFDQHWSTRPRRLTALIGEIKRLADASNAVPHAYSFGHSTPESEQKASTGSRRSTSVGAEEVTINFSVDASYDQARRMINLIELSQQFMIIDSVSLSAGDQNRLTLNLRVKTLFRDEQQPAAANRL